MVSNNLNSVSVISIPSIGGLFHNGFTEIMNIPEFRKKIVYRRVDLDYDNITGDLDKSSYTDYQIIASIYIMDITYKKTMSGELQVADGEMFIPARINRDIDNDVIYPEFRPNIDDNIFWLGIWYKISEIEFNKIGFSEVYCTCKLKKINNTLPDFKWNKHYTIQPQMQNPGGWS
jgi:hypothetical protein